MGEVGEAQIEERARELAMIAGLPPGEATDAHRAQAARELRGTDDDSFPNDEEAALAGSIDRDDIPGERGGAVMPETDAAASEDEETVGEALYAEGIAEADHDRMVASRQSDLDEEAED